MQIQISWLLKKPNDLDLHCLQRQGISGFSRPRVKLYRDDEGVIMEWKNRSQVRKLLILPETLCLSYQSRVSISTICISQQMFSVCLLFITKVTQFSYFFRFFIFHPSSHSVYFKIQMAHTKRDFKDFQFVVLQMCIDSPLLGQQTCVFLP